MQLEINDRRKVGKFTNAWKLNNILLMTNGSKKKSKEISKGTEMNENGNTTHQNSWEAAKAVLGGKYSNKCLY